MNARYQYASLALIMAASLALNLTGVNWGIPSAERAALVMPPSMRTPAFFGAMTAAREDIYRFSRNSSLGRVSDSKTVTPIMRSMGISGREGNVAFGNDEKTLANFVRPYLLRTYHMDEQMTIAALAGMKPKKLDFNPRLFQYGGAYIYGTGAWLALTSAARLTDLKADIAYYYANPSKMGGLFAAGRAMNSVFILFGAVMLFLTGRRFFAPEAGLAAAALFALSPAVVFEAHILKPYCMSASFALACLYFSLKLLEAEPRPSDAAAAGAFLGLTAGSMPFFGIAAIAPFLSLLASRRLFSKYSVSVLIAAAAAFAATNPYWLLDARNLMFELTSFGSGREAPGPGLFAGYIFRQMPLGVSAAALLLAAAGIALAAAKKNAALLVTAATGAVPVLFSAWILRAPELSIVNSRLLIPWIGMLALCAGSLLSRQFAPSGTAAYAARAAVAAALVHSLLLSAVYAGLFRNESASGSLRLAAGKWINGNIPAGSSIGVTALPEPTHVPPYEFTKYKTVLYLDDTAKDSPRYVVTTEDLPGLFREPEKWTLLKRFEPGPEPFGLKFRYRAPGLFSPVTIYRRT